MTYPAKLKHAAWTAALDVVGHVPAKLKSEQRADFMLWQGWFVRGYMAGYTAAEEKQCRKKRSTKRAQVPLSQPP